MRAVVISSPIKPELLRVCVCQGSLYRPIYANNRSLRRPDCQNSSLELGTWYSQMQSDIKCLWVVQSAHPETYYTVAPKSVPEERSANLHVIAECRKSFDEPILINTSGPRTVGRSHKFVILATPP